MKLLLIIAGTLAIGVGGLILWAGSAEQPEAWDPPPAPAPLSVQRGELRLTVWPRSAVIDHPVSMAVQGSEPREVVVLRAWTVDGQGNRFASWARFTSDELGEVRTATMRPLEGTYRSVDASGLFWSMVSPGAHAYEFPAATSNVVFHVSAETASGVAVTDVSRVNPLSQIVPQGIEQDGVHGQFWLPPVDGLVPAVVRLHGSDGELNALQAALLAESGIAVLDLRYIDAGLPEIVAVPVERVLHGIDWLARHPRVDESRIAVFGVSKGAELALYAATLDDRVRAVVAWSPASVLFEGISVRQLSPGSSWSLQGRPTAYASFRMEPVATLRHMVRLLFRNVSFLPIYEQALDSAPDAARIRVEQIDGHILLLAGRDDRLWPAARMAAALESRLVERGHRKHELVLYEDAGHRMTYAVWPDLHAPSRFVGGGTPEGNHRAGRDAWQRIKAFLATCGGC